MKYKTCDNQVVRIIDVDYKNKNALVEIISEFENYPYFNAVVFENYYFKNNILCYKDINWQDLAGLNEIEAQNYFNRYYRNSKNYTTYIDASYIE